MNRVDKRKVAAAFSRQARHYDEHAALQRHVVAQLVTRVGAVAPHPRAVLDVGAGTGSLLHAIAARHPGVVAAGIDLAPGMVHAARQRGGPRHVVADAEALPFRAAAFDVVASASAYQWMEDLRPAFAEARRVLAPDGWLVCALFGGETLRELRDAWRSADGPASPDGADRLHAFFSTAQVRSALADAGFRHVEVSVERAVEHHADLPQLLRSLKRIGAGNASPGASGGLADRRLLLRAAEAYERLRESAGLPSTWDVVFATAR